MADGSWREIGELVPEAATWPNLRPWLGDWITEVPDPVAVASPTVGLDVTRRKPPITIDHGIAVRPRRKATATGG